MERHTKLLQFRAPESLSEAIDAAAKREFQSKSEYVRRSVIDRLRADGIEPSLLAVV
ncbi:ribbon-helix-helix protein, CopG family [Nitrobacter vulgaris]|uniref:ribbon-helix-helix protein, CopG family n=1 Tax=Nitrobacter vulgaris TaxID=29421 RepID=UPI001570440D|nr:ribbon-helix-helix protein, CopG family [Nitrobacter vulgaris]